MTHKINDIYVNFSKKTIEQKIDFTLFSLTIFIIITIIIGNVYVYYYVEDPKSITLVVSIFILITTFSITPQYISNTKLIIRNNYAIIYKRYFGGLYIKKEEIDKESVLLAKVITKEYDELGKENGSQIRYWIASSKYSDFNIIRIRKKENIVNIQKSLNTIFEREVIYRTITIEKTKPNNFINNYN